MSIDPFGYDEDRQFELQVEAIHAKEAHSRVKVQGTVDIRLNGAQLATIDPNTGTITGLPNSLDFAQFEFINRIYNAITTKP